jgi:hypothetical protein
MPAVTFDSLQIFLFYLLTCNCLHKQMSCYRHIGRPTRCLSEHDSTTVFQSSVSYMSYSLCFSTNLYSSAFKMCASELWYRVIPRRWHAVA